MERHNTHILSDSEEEDDADENNHLYYFNDSNSNSESNSDKNTIYSNTKKTDPFKIDDLKSNDNCKKEIMDESLISIKDLEEMFYNENRYTKPTNHSKIKENKKKKNNKKENKEENNIEKNKENKEENDIDNNKDIKENNNIDDNKDIKENNIIEDIKENNNIDDNKDIKENNIIEDNKEIEENEEKQEIKKPEINSDDVNNKNIKKKKVKNNIKIQVIKLNFDDNASSIKRDFKLTPRLINFSDIKKSEKKINCTFPNVSNENRKKYRLNKKNEDSKNENKQDKKLKKKKKLNLAPQSDSKSNRSSNNSKKDLNNISNLFDILKNKNLKSLKICKNSFFIPTKKSNSIEAKIQTFKKGTKSSNSSIYQINKQNDFYLKQDYELNLFKKEYFSPEKIKINGIKRFEILQNRKEDDKYNEYNSKFVLTNNNNSQYSFRYHNNNSTNYNYNKYSQKKYEDEINNGYNIDYNGDNTGDYNRNINYNQDYINCMDRIKRMNRYGPTKNMKQNSGINLRGDRKIKILYDLYCKRPNKENKNIPRINSAHSIKDINMRNNINRNAYNLIDLNGNFENKDKMIQNRLYNNNNKNWLLKLLKVQKEKNLYHYEKHFGNNENCPLCQQLDKKNEEQIKKIGVYHMSSDQKNMEIKKHSKKRRINSAYPNLAKNKPKYFDKKELINESRNNMNYNKSTGLFNEYNINRKITNNNNLKRRFQTNKQNYLKSNYS